MKKAIKKLKKQVSGILDILELIPTRAELQTIAKHVQNLEAEKCSCHTNKPKAEFDKELFGKLFTENFQEESREIKVNAVNEMMHKGKSIVDVMKESIRNAVAKATAKTIADMVIHTNTQKTDKNATEGKQEGKKEYSEVIVTNGMFNEELERFLREETTFYPIQKYTSTDNSTEYITSLVYDFHCKTQPEDNIYELIKSKLKSKGEHYNKESDRYANIKDALKRNKEEQPHLFANWTVVDKINSYKDKHVQWLIDTRGTEQTKTDLQEAYIDVICYCIMCYIYLKFNGEVRNG